MDFARLRKTLNARLADLEGELATAETPTITALSRVFYGLNLTLRRRSLHIENSTTGCRFSIDPESGEIAATPL